MAMRLLWTLLLAWPGLVFAAGELATATIVDGTATVMRASGKFVLAEGGRLVPEDIVETGSARHVRVEFADGLLLDLGPATSVQLRPRLTGEAARRTARVYLLRGWVKLSAAPAGASGPLLTSAGLDVAGARRGVVIGLEGEELAVFAESGDAALAERRPGAKPAPVTLKEGGFYSRSGSAAGEVATSPRAGFIPRVPKAFLDTLPARAALFRDKAVASAAPGALVYADVQPWIDAEPALRGGFVTRWRALAQQAEFRKALVQGLAAHPEWDRVLFPERYLPKPASSPVTAPRPAAHPGTTRYGSP
jgi:hypothetical protein